MIVDLAFLNAHPFDSIATAAMVVVVVMTATWLAVIRPLRARVVAEAARASAIIESSSDAIVAVGEGGRIRLFNPAAQRLFGWSADEVIGHPFLILVADEERERQLQVFLDDWRNPHGRFPRALGEVQSKRRDGSCFTVDLTLGMTEAGGTRTVVAMMRDVSERKRAEAERLAEGQGYRALIEHSNDVIARVSIGGTLLYASPAFERILGFPASEWIDASIFDLAWPDDVATMAEVFQRSLDMPGTTIPWQLRLRHRDGTYRWLDGRGTNLAHEPSVGCIVVNAHDVTARKQAEVRLRTLSRAIEQSPVSIVITDPQGSIEYVNPKFCAVTGYAMDEVLGRNPRILKSGETPPSVYRHLWETIRSGTQWSGELHNRRKNGELYWEQVSISPIVDDAGEVVHFVAVKEDITARKRTERELGDYALQLMQSQRVARLGSYELDLETLTWTCSPMLNEIFGIQRTPLSRNAAGWLSLVHPDDREAMAGYLQGVVAGRGRRFDREYRIIRPDDGAERWVHGLGELVIDDRGRPAKLMGTVQDVTERRVAEAELRTRERQLHQAFEDAAIGMAWVSPAGRWLKVNRAFCQMIGYERDRLETQESRDISHPDDAEAEASCMQRLLSGERQTYELEKRYIHRDGREVWAQVSAALATDGDGRPLHFIMQIRDTTAIRETQLALARRARELAEANRILHDERSQREKVERELRLAQKLEAIGQLAAGIAHEINTPMQFIGDSTRYLVTAFGGVVEALDAYREATDSMSRQPGQEAVRAALDQALEQADVEFAREEIPRALDRVMDGTGRVTGIVRAMKEFAHPDTRERAAADINRMLTTTLTVARNEYKHVADVETDLGDLPPVVCNVGEVNQVFLNILVNAAHAVGAVAARTQAKGRIVVRSRHESDAVVVEIEDTGDGIPEAAQERVFDPFFTTKPVGKGTGQGLAIARSIVVDKHGGSLTFRTEAGVGTTFAIRLPVAADVQTQEAA